MLPLISRFYRLILPQTAIGAAETWTTVPNTSPQIRSARCGVKLSMLPHPNAPVISTKSSEHNVPTFVIAGPLTVNEFVSEQAVYLIHR